MDADPVVTTSMFTPAEQAAWAVAVERGLPVTAVDLRVMLEAAAPLLADTVAQKILKHMEEHGPGPASPGVTLHETMRRAWHRHFGIAARIAAGTFYTREDELRLAAQAIERGDVIACDIPEVPREP